LREIFTKRTRESITHPLESEYKILRVINLPTKLTLGITRYYIE